MKNFLEDKTQDGKKISPVLPKGIKNYLIDIDGTICDDIPNEEPERMETANLYPDALDSSITMYLLMSKIIDNGSIPIGQDSTQALHVVHAQISSLVM